MTLALRHTVFLDGERPPDDYVVVNIVDAPISDMARLHHFWELIDYSAKLLVAGDRRIPRPGESVRT
jgi:hypothetical protein